MSENRFKFTIIDIKVIEDTSLSNETKMVFVVLSRFADLESGKCHPKRKTIAKLADVSLKTVTEATNKLADKGYISKARKWKINEYTIHFIANRDIPLHDSKVT